MLGFQHTLILISRDLRSWPFCLTDSEIGYSVILCDTTLRPVSLSRVTNGRTRLEAASICPIVSDRDFSTSTHIHSHRSGLAQRALTCSSAVGWDRRLDNESEYILRFQFPRVYILMLFEPAKIGQQSWSRRCAPVRQPLSICSIQDRVKEIPQTANRHYRQCLDGAGHHHDRSKSQLNGILFGKEVRLSRQASTKVPFIMKWPLHPGSESSKVGP